MVGLLASCAPAKPEKLDRPKPIRRHEPSKSSAVIESRPLLVERPALEVPEVSPDFHDELRWPLSSMSHPALEPKFDIAAQLAEPGIGWTELCSRGVQNRTSRDKELTAYLRGWCYALKGDIDAACANLVPLLNSTTARLAPAVRTDLANILANGHVDAAQRLINVHKIRDVAMLDILAANYVEVGTTDEAIAINRQAIDSDDYASSATKCMRWTKHIILSRDPQSALFREIESLVTQVKAPDHTCVRLYHKLQCWQRPALGCNGFMVDLGFKESQVDLLNAYFAWPSNDADPDQWTDTFTRAIDAVPMTGSVELSIAALQNVMRTTSCSKTMYAWFRQHVDAVRHLLSADDAARIDALLDRCAK